MLKYLFYVDGKIVFEWQQNYSSKQKTKEDKNPYFVKVKFKKKIKKCMNIKNGNFL